MRLHLANNFSDPVSRVSEGAGSNLTAGVDAAGWLTVSALSWGLGARNEKRSVKWLERYCFFEDDDVE